LSLYTLTSCTSKDTKAPSSWPTQQNGCMASQ